MNGTLNYGKWGLSPILMNKRGLSAFFSNRRMKHLGLAPFSFGLRFYLLMAAVLLSTTLSFQAFANASVTTLAFANVSGSNFDSGAWVSLTGPILTEGAHADISTTGTIILNAPAGFVFNPAATDGLCS